MGLSRTKKKKKRKGKLHDLGVVSLRIQEEKEEDEAPSDRGKEEWACGLLSLFYKHCMLFI